MIGAQFLIDDFKSDSNINDYKPYFLDYEANKNEYSNSGYFEYKHEVGGDITLFFVTVNGEFSLRYDYNVPNSSSEPSYYSIGNPDTINEIVDAGDENMIPLGSLLNADAAWLALNEFFNNPKQKPASIKWINAEELNWDGVE